LNAISAGPAPSAGPSASHGALLTRLARFGQVHLSSAVTSTNDVARRLTAQSQPAIVIADRQTRGRGRFAREWYSPEGGLWLSLLLYPDLPKERLGLITLVAGLAVAKVIEAHTGLKPELLWPNDVTVNGKKVAGILCEARGKAVIVGIGLNVSQDSFPAKLPDASSLRLLSGRNLERFELLVGLVEEFHRLLAELTAGKSLPVLGELKSRMPMLGRPVTLETGWAGLGSLTMKHVSGTALDLADSGELLLRLPDGAMRSFRAGKVVRVR
jgi:BirA family biotin operon repressor/biotin-[acetyl-CoA-carboxylase] ligase